MLPDEMPGRSAAQACSAACTVGLDGLNVVDVEPDAADPVVPDGRVTPWIFRQLR